MWSMTSLSAEAQSAYFIVPADGAGLCKKVEFGSWKVFLSNSLTVLAASKKINGSVNFRGVTCTLGKLCLRLSKI